MSADRPQVAHSKSWTFFEDQWQEGNIPIMGVRSHAAWLGSMVFDGGRVFERTAPDLDQHCARINVSAVNMMLKPLVGVDRWMELAREGIAKFAPDAALYVRPMYWPEAGLVGGGVLFDPDTTRWCLCVYESPMPDPTAGIAATLSPYRKPTIESAPVDAKAGCLYPNNAKALAEARTRGFGNCLMRDMLGNIAELANSNIFMAKDGVVYTPAPNGTFLDGVTRRRVISLLREAGVSVVETTLVYAHFQTADEIFSSGNFAKVMPVTRLDDRSLQPGPLFQQARELYWRFAHGSGRLDA